MDTIGYHYVVEASGCNQDMLADPDLIRETLQHAAREGGMEVKTTYFYRFAPKAVSGVVIVAESHITVHTWPERSYAALDVYVCGEKADPERPSTSSCGPWAPPTPTSRRSSAGWRTTTCSPMPS